MGGRLPVAMRSPIGDESIACSCALPMGVWLFNWRLIPDTEAFSPGCEALSASGLSLEGGLKASAESTCSRLVLLTCECAIFLAGAEGALDVRRFRFVGGRGMVFIDLDFVWQCKVYRAKYEVRRDSKK